MARRMRSLVFTADGSGNIQDCDQGGGVGLAIIGVTGGYPVTATFDRDNSQGVTFYGPEVRYFAERFESLDLDAYHVSIEWRCCALFNPGGNDRQLPVGRFEQLVGDG